LVVLISVKAALRPERHHLMMSETLDTPAATPFALLGGEAGVRRLVEAFYDVMEDDPEFAALRAIHAADLGPMRARLADWLTGWMGGPPVYAVRHPDRPCVVSAHKAFPIDTAMAEAWVACMRKAFAAADVPDKVREMLAPAFSSMCQALRNR